MEENLSKGEMVIYASNDGHVSLDVRLKKETIWLTQVQIADLFSVKRPAISKHIKNIFESGELIEDSVVSILETTAKINQKEHWLVNRFNEFCSNFDMTSYMLNVDGLPRFSEYFKKAFNGVEQVCEHS